jgi:hypothetical protein
METKVEAKSIRLDNDSLGHTACNRNDDAAGQVILDLNHRCAQGGFESV